MASCGKEFVVDLVETKKSLNMFLFSGKYDVGPARHPLDFHLPQDLKVPTGKAQMYQDIRRDALAQIRLLQGIVTDDNVRTVHRVGTEVVWRAIFDAAATVFGRNLNRFHEARDKSTIYQEAKESGDRNDRRVAKLEIMRKKLKARKCPVCNAHGAKRCGRCKRVWYCGQVCQRSDWSNHKKTCSH